MWLTTRRLTIRDFRIEDIEDALRYLGDSETMKYIEPVYNLDMTAEFVQEAGIERKLVFAVEENETKRVVGHVIFHPFCSEKEYELGGIFGSDSVGRGYGEETGNELIRYGFEELGISCIAAEAVRENKASINLIRKLAMEYSGQDEGLNVYKIKKEAWKRR